MEDVIEDATFDVAFRIEGRFRLDASSPEEATDIVELMEARFVIDPAAKVRVTDVYEVQPDGTEPKRCALCLGVIPEHRKETAHARGGVAKYDTDRCRTIAAKRRWRVAHPGAGATAKPRKRKRKVVR